MNRDVKWLEDALRDTLDALHGLVGDDGVLTEMEACQCVKSMHMVCRVCDARRIFVETELALQNDERLSVFSVNVGDVLVSKSGEGCVVRSKEGLLHWGNLPLTQRLINDLGLHKQDHVQPATVVQVKGLALIQLTNTLVMIGNASHTTEGEQYTAFARAMNRISEAMTLLVELESEGV